MIVMEKLSSKPDKVISLLLQTRTYLEYTDTPAFWGRVKYALGRDLMGREPANQRPQLTDRQKGQTNQVEDITNRSKDEINQQVDQPNQPNHHNPTLNDQAYLQQDKINEQNKADQEENDINLQINQTKETFDHLREMYKKSNLTKPALDNIATEVIAGDVRTTASRAAEKEAEDPTGRKRICKKDHGEGPGAEALEIERTSAEALELKGTGEATFDLKGTGTEALEQKGTGAEALELKGTGAEALELKGTGAEALALKLAGLKDNAADAIISSTVVSIGTELGDLRISLGLDRNPNIVVTGVQKSENSNLKTSGTLKSKNSSGKKNKQISLQNSEFKLISLQTSEPERESLQTSEFKKELGKFHQNCENESFS